MKKNIKLQEKVSILPEKPGVYQFFDKNDTIIYIGKAKNLKKRVKSYFTKNSTNAKTLLLIKLIQDVNHIVVNTEIDALLLESNLIKKHKPKYNILLKDGKSYPWICIKNEAFPRIYSTRNIIKDGSQYFGPFISHRLVRTMLKMFIKLYKIRTCKLNLSKENINKKKFKVCLEYHIKNCKAPCVGKQSLEEYSQNINDIKKILKGRVHKVISYLKKEMSTFAENLEFEKAQIQKEKINLLENYQSKSTIVNPLLNNILVFSIIEDEKISYVNSLKIANGKIIKIQSYEIKRKLEETTKEILTQVITTILQTNKQDAINLHEILVPIEINYPDDRITVRIPKIGDKKKLLELSEKNLKYFRLEKQKIKHNIDPNKNINRVLSTMQKDLKLQKLPIHIECFDNSNTQGTNPVSACVVFRNGKASKKDYRKFNIKTVKGIDDFASMKEVVLRRYSRLIKEKEKLPQLIIIDGGKGQLSSAVESLKKLNIYKKIKIIGIAKRLEEIFFPEDPVPIYLDKNSETLKLIQRARDEAHRYSITFHRAKRNKKMLETELIKIKGIGEKTALSLITKYKSIKNIKTKNIKELELLIGASKTKIIANYFEIHE